MKTLKQTVKDELLESLETHFPKGKCKERGSALVLFADAYLALQTLIKAFGGCEKCYGKGYGTQILNYHGSADFPGDKSFNEKAPTVVFCDCERGKQLEKLIGEQA